MASETVTATAVSAKPTHSESMVIEYTFGQPAIHSSQPCVELLPVAGLLAALKRTLTQPHRGLVV